jgi:arylsulfatase A-like enzyme
MGALTRGARANAPWTVPSHGSIFSGLLPNAHGVTGRTARSSDRRLTSLRPAIERLSDRWLPEVFHRAGFETTAISANVWITREMGFDVGFDRFVPVGMAAIAPRGGPANRRLRDALPRPARDAAKNLLRYGKEAIRGRDFGANAAVSAARDLLKEARRPFFWFVNVMEAHAPYLPPARFLPRWGPERLLAPSVVHRYLNERFVFSHNLGRGTLPSRAAVILRELYAGGISYTDDFLRRFVEVLEPALEETVLVVTSDHGEHLGERHLLGHQLALDDELLNVPLVALGPGVPRESTASVFPLNGLPAMLASAAGLRRPHPWEEPGMIAVARYESGWEQIRRAPELVDDLRLTSEELARLRSPMVSATDGITTLTVSAAGETLDGDPSAVDRLRAAAAPSGGQDDQPADGTTPEEEAEIEERLRSLGYL